MKIRKSEKSALQNSSRVAPASYEQIKWTKENPMATFEEFKKKFPEGTYGQYEYCITLIN